MYLGGNHHNHNDVSPPGGIQSGSGAGQHTESVLRAASDVEKQGNQAQKIKIRKIN